MVLPTVDELKECVEVGERYFGTAGDPTQSEATVENCQKTIALEEHAFVIERLGQSFDFCCSQRLKGLCGSFRLFKIIKNINALGFMATKK